MRTEPNEHFDVLIVGAGLSGIGAGCHLTRECPDRSYVILEAREDTGGTWDLFRYPGIRSDSDMHTLGYSFKPWKDAKTIADGPSILSYIRETASEYGVGDHIRCRHRVVSAAWDSSQARWAVTAERGDAGDTVVLTCSFLLMCSGYYDYGGGYTPQFEGMDRFRGALIHPQQWPEELDYAGKRVLVIGSGATAVTLVPAMARKAAHVTMLQRSPSYMVSLPAVDPLAKLARRMLPTNLAYQAVRWKNVALMALSYQLSRRRPQLIKAIIRRGVASQLPEGYEVDTHFKPSYNPWDQRLCVCPDGDLFEAIRDGAATIVTDEVQRFTETGVELRGGGEVEADVVVTATGLQLLPLGGLELTIDGRRLDLPERMTYKGMMLGGVPNAALVIGYTNASWTLKCDLTLEYVCRLLNHMRERDYAYCVPRDADPEVVSEPLLNLNSGYILRSVDKFPRQGSVRPWRVYQNYALDMMTLRLGSVEDGVMRFVRSGPAAAGSDSDSDTDKPPAPAVAAA
jgi:cation diffusion facilitator CzcD-associated flavoprotein CzcO